MPDDRLIHKTFGHSEKVNKLTDFEILVWMMYKLASDDFGVMRYSALTLQEAARFLEKRPARTVLRGLESVHEVGLIDTFEHQGRTYCYQTDWQTWQKITHPRQTRQPAPICERCDRNTRWLLSHHPKGGRLKSWQAPDDWKEKTGSTPGEKREHSRPVFVSVGNDRGCVSDSGEAVGAQTPETRASNFTQWYEDTHQRILGVGYMGTNKDWGKTLELVDVFTDQELQDAALVWFGDDDGYATETTRSIVRFAPRVSGYLLTIKKQGIA